MWSFPWPSSSIHTILSQDEPCVAEGRAVLQESAIAPSRLPRLAFWRCLETSSESQAAARSDSRVHPAEVLCIGCML